MSLLSCSHIEAYKEEKKTNGYPIIHAYFIASKSQGARLKKSKECFCFYCKTRCHRLHACLDCEFFGCFERKHIHAHAESLGHSFGIDITFGHIYCFICKDYMYDADLEDLSRTQSLTSKGYNGPWQPNESDAMLFRKCSESDITMGQNLLGKYLGLRGLVNLGNTCYMNSILQVLIHNPLLKNFFLSDKHNSYTCQFHCDRSTCLACEMAALFQEFFSGKNTPHIPYQLVYFIWKRAKELRGYRQQDAHEFFITMLDVLHEHLKGLNEDENCCQCIIHRIYTGFLQSDVICLDCKNVRTKIDEFRDISLYLGTNDTPGNNSEKVSFIDCLERFTQPEQLQSNCESCKKVCLSTKQLTVQKLPAVISFRLNRICYDERVTTFVSFPEYLNMTPFVSSRRSLSCEINGENHYTTHNSNNDYNFCLFAVVNHFGGTEHGHYTSFIKMKQKWYRCDDEIITLASVNDVLCSEGYLLFYHKEVLE